jgi:GntR family transcriptional regulator, transcriptional repressor for pyruvate dehydrogenase complex
MSMENVYIKPIRPKNVSDQVYEQLRDLIFRGEFPPGKKLPPERELAEAFGISRPSIKTAINRLVNQGLVTQKQGRGTFVLSMASRYMENPLRQVLEGEEVSLYDLLEVRLGLETQTVGLAAKRADANDIRALETSLDEMLAKVDKGEVGSQEDVSFHMNIAYATKNLAQIYLMKNFYDLLFYGINKSRFFLYEAGNLPTIGRQHKEILQAIRDRDPVSAQNAMDQHIRYVMDFCEKQNL